MSTETTVTIDFHGEALVLDPEAAIWWPSTRSLILSDVHLGKSSVFRRMGIPVPDGELREDLERIQRLVEHYGPASLHIVGDLLHSKSEVGDELVGILSDWIDALPASVFLVRGNHDPSRRQLESIKALESLDTQRIGGILLVHDPDDAPDDSPLITGHLHPLCRIGRKTGPSVKVPCFYRDGRRLVLPAFGTFTSGTVVRADSPQTTLYPILQGRVFPGFKRR